MVVELRPDSIPEENLKSDTASLSQGSPRGQKARDAILRAGGQVFSQVGFHRASIRAIGQAAKVNLAAVSYHFGGKEALYRSVVRSVPRLASCADVSQWETAHASVRLRHLIRSALKCLDGRHDGPCAWRLLARECIDPTPAFQVLVETFARPTLRWLTDSIKCASKASIMRRKAEEAAEWILQACIAWRLLPKTSQEAGLGTARTNSRHAERIANHALDYVRPARQIGIGR